MNKVKTEPGIMDWLNKDLRKDPAARRRVEEMSERILVRQDLIALRKARGLTQKQLAGRMGVSQPVVAELESSAPRNIELRTLVRAAAALGATLRISFEIAAPRGRARSKRPRKAAA
jgi:DNA-binding XRE family transcriptional regulator